VTPAAGSPPPGAARALLRALDAVARALAYASGALFFLVSFYVAADAVWRTFFHFSTAVTDEFGGYILALGAMLALAYTLRVGAHVRIDILLPYLPLRMQIVLNYVAMAGMALCSGMLAIYTWRLAIESLATDARAMSFLRTPLFPAQGLVAFGLSMLCLEALVILAVGIVESVRQRRLAPPEGFDVSEAELS
jgi:TRAP-type C4-dicarboxylate transport system permease small subunit